MLSHLTKDHQPQSLGVLPLPLARVSDEPSDARGRARVWATISVCAMLAASGCSGQVGSGGGGGAANRSIGDSGAGGTNMNTTSGSGGSMIGGPGSGGGIPAVSSGGIIGLPGAGGGLGTGGSITTGGATGQSGGSRASGGTTGQGGGGASSSGGATGGSGGQISTGGGSCPKTTCTICGPGQNLHNLNNDNWAGSLTLFISYSADTRHQTVDKGYTSAEWNAAVNSFDVPSFAAQVKATGARNILLMLGQNTGYYCSPNAAYEHYAGVAPGTRCSTRDLPMEIADALAAKGIGMYLYLPEDVGWGDTKAANAFGLSALAVGNWVVDNSFTPKWNAVVKTWADRYGSKVKGWFFDGYETRWGVTQAMAQTYRSTCLAANPCGVVTFNGGGSDTVSDTERGETKLDPATGFPAKGLPTARWDNKGLQVMWDFPLQAAWGQEIGDDSPAVFTNANLKTFITAAIKAQAVFALDVRTSLAGKLSVPIYNQLVAIKQ